MALAQRPRTPRTVAGQKGIRIAQGASQPWSELVVEFVAKNAETLKAAIEDNKKLLEAAKKATDQLGQTSAQAAKEAVAGFGRATSGAGAYQAQLDKIQTQLAGIQKGTDQVGRIAALAYAKAGLELLGWVRAGLSASAMGQALGLQMDILSRTIAGVFAPEIAKLIQGIARLSEWIRNLSDKQKENIVQWVKGAAAAIAVAVVLPKVFAGIGMVVAGVRALSVAFAGATLAAGAILPLVSAIVTGFAALAVGTETGRGALGGFLQVLRPFLAALANMGRQVLAALAPLVAPLSDLFQSIVAVLQAILPPIAAVMANLAKVIVAAIQIAAPFVKLLVDLFGAVFAAITPLIVAVTDVAAAVGGALASAFEAVAPILRVVGGLLQMVFGWLEKIANVVGKVISGIVSVVTAPFRFLGRIFGGSGDREIEARPKPPEEQRRGRGGRDILAPRMGGFEQIQDVYMRIAQASVQATAFTRSVPEQQLDEQRGTNERLGRIEDGVRRLRPAFS